MALRPTLVVLLFAAAALAGCSSNSGDTAQPHIADINQPDVLPPSAPAPTITEPVPAIKGAGSSTTPATWWTNSYPVDKEAVRSILWRVPASAKGPVSLDVQPLYDDSKKVDEHGFLVFRFKDNKAELVAAHLGAPLNIADRGVPDMGTKSRLELKPEPFRLALPGVAPGEVVGIVSAGQGDIPAFGFAWTLSTGSLAKDSDAFTAGLAPNGGATVLAIGSTPHFQGALYADLNKGILAAPPGFSGVELWTDTLKVRDAGPVDGRPIVSLRSATLGVDFDSKEGWGYAAGYHNATLGATVWRVNADIHGVSLTNAAITVDAAAVSTAGVLTNVLGAPAFIVTTDGKGGSSLDVNLVDAQVDLMENIIVVEFDLDSTVEMLFGLPAQTISAEESTVLPLP